MAGEGKHSRDARGIVSRLIDSTTAMLTTPQIVARTGLSRPVVGRTLAALEAEGRVGRVAGKPLRWYWVASPNERAEVA